MIGKKKKDQYHIIYIINIIRDGFSPHSNKPVDKGCGCYCREYKGLIFDSDIGPGDHSWTSENKPFCTECFEKLVEDGYLKSNLETIISDEEEEFLESIGLNKELREQAHENVAKMIQEYANNFEE